MLDQINSISPLQTTEPLVQLYDVTKRYGRTLALDDVSLKISHGITGLLGPNGAGKSTLIKVLLGLVRTNGGTGAVLGYDLGREARLIRDHVGYMPEDDCYFSGQTGIGALRFSARLAGLPSVEGLRRAHEILDFCGMEQERYREVDTYSTGMRQKLKFAQAIVHDPPLLILDEPTSGLDPEERVAMLSRIRVLANRAGKAVIVSTHILPDVQTLCDDVVILVAGQVRLEGRLDELNRPSSPAIVVRPMGPVQALVDRIRAAGIEVHEQVDGSLQIEGTEQGIGDRVWQWAAEAGVTVRTLMPARNSLEQTFMEAVRGGERADS